ncbi:hypothetical protein GAP32_049 [Cronobacter phage vB_CsaM_GAP32]|uniref:Uncharacterized protein n=1 Tax=Cronobacter phage vB_CsaM_GAP32 TaxID=1141136 RepID=K4F757_9CAUD|nr:hypothetical protein GAP32_049 [Cronobacter phage vB_CsaM_GAP32]AFC21497.1 hypothetical protein GAP32_049 [Cronobacter phage vB_CsaM_GAP32]
MIEELQFQTTIIKELCTMYKTILPLLQKQEEAGYTGSRRYFNSFHSTVFNAQLECTVTLNPTAASITYISPKLYKSVSQTFCTVYNKRMNERITSMYNSFSLLRMYGSVDDSMLLVKDDHDSIIKLADSYDDDILEAMAFQLLTKYDPVRVQAILLDQVLYCDIKDFKRIVVQMVPFSGLGTDKENELIKAFNHTVLGLQHEIENLS